MSKDIELIDLKAEVRIQREANDEYTSFLVLVAEGKSWPYMVIPEGIPNHILQTCLYKLNA